MKEKNLLVLDLGNALNPHAPATINRIKKDAAIKAMEMTGCSAMGIGPYDISAGYRFIDAVNAKDLPPMVAANLEAPADLAGFIKKYLVVTVDGIRFGITSVMPDISTRSLISTQFHVSDAETALGQILPELKAKSDFIILLSQFPTEQTQNLAESFPMINLSLCTTHHSLLDLGNPSGLRVLNVVYRAQQLGIVEIEKKNDKAIIKDARRIQLNQDIPSDPDMEAVVSIAMKKIHLQKQATRDKNKKKQAFETLKMTPEEFIKSYNPN